MRDIQNRQDLEWLMEQFYSKLLADTRISYIFTQVAKIDLQAHLPKIVDFWEQLLFNTGNYKNNVLKIHLEINRLEKLTPIHFEIWLYNFNEIVNLNFVGKNANMMLTRALSIATVMKIKLQ